MGTVTVDLGFEKKSGRITIDGQPSGKSVYSDPKLWKDTRFDPRPREQSNRQRLMLGSSRAAVVWAGMPKPNGKDAEVKICPECDGLNESEEATCNMCTNWLAGREP